MATPSEAEYEAVVTAAQAIIDCNGPYASSVKRDALQAALEAVVAAKAAP